MAFLPASVFNQIPRFEQQTQSVPQDILNALCEIFVQHAMHTRVGVALLHRHFDLSEGQIMLHRSSGDCTEVISAYGPDPQEIPNIKPCALFLLDGQGFRPYEYGLDSDMSGLNGDFLQDCQRLLLSSNLQAVLSLVQLPRELDEDSVISERQFPGRSETEVERRTQANKAATVTGWRFGVDRIGLPHVVDFAICRKDEFGVHHILPDPKPK